ncbi:sulfatase [Thermococcus sibiricus]|uniref:Sulfatase n=1 Tax=Thermococcus sibiricus TaxID=172049 RepID=A0A124FF79_9EURY|nr:sulfatase [Thermococcus sibiricus]KUK17259.1 MAG: Sulfatase [Thermococcus sibiricus]
MVLKSITTFVKNLVAKNEFTKRLSLKLYSQYREYKAKREFYSRIRDVNMEEYVDVSNRPDMNVIILAVDCLRYSNLSFAGYHRETTPFLDSLKVNFRAVSAAPWTYPSVASILTGLYPHNHNAYIHDKVKNFDNLKGFKPIRKSVLTLPEILFLLNYEIYFGTAIDVASYPLKGRLVPKRYLGDTPAEKLLNDLRKWIVKRKKPFFAYVQLGDLHEPLVPPKEFRNYFGKVEKLPNIERWAFGRPEEQKGEKFQEYKENRILLYDNTLRYVDYALEQFYSFLEDSGLLDSTILVITADHGEEFWEHAKLEAENFYDPRGYYGVGHGHNVFNEIIEVPIILDGAVKNRGEYTGNRVSSVDITPTILDMLGVSHNLTFDGQNLFKVKEKKRPLLAEAVGYGYEKKALILGRYKLLYAPEDGVQWVFDLKKDPYEQHPIKDGEVTSIFVEKLNRTLRESEKKN